MIILIGGFEIAVILIIFIAIIAGAAETIINMVNILITIFIAKNIIQTVILGYFKEKNPLSTTIGFLLIDSVRMWVFFSNLQMIGMTFANATGLKYFTALLSFILYFLICGCIFLLGEFISLGQSFGKKNDKSENNKIILASGIATVLILMLVTWIGYQ